MTDADPYVSDFDGGEPRYFALVDDEGNVIPGSAVGIVRCGVCAGAVFDLDQHRRWHAGRTT